MRRLNGTEMKALLVLSIVVPVGLLATLRLTGVLPEPAMVIVAEDTVLEPVSWEAERPDKVIRIMNLPRIQSLYEKEIELAQEVQIWLFYPHDDFIGGGSDNLEFMVNATATLQEGFIASANVTFRENYGSQVVFFTEGGLAKNLNLQNLSLTSYKNYGQSGDLKAFFTLKGGNDAKQVHFDHWVAWLLRSPYNTTHLLEVTTDFVYNNGTTYKRVVQPFHIKLDPDENNTPQTATELHEGNYTGLWLGEIDNKDFYKFFANQGQRIKLHTDSPWNDPLCYYVYIYDPDGKLIDTVDQEYMWHYTLDFTSNSTGYWTIKLQTMYGCGFYQIEVSA